MFASLLKRQVFVEMLDCMDKDEYHLYKFTRLTKNTFLVITKKKSTTCMTKMLILTVITKIFMI
jgi:hypothetical protein